MGFPVIKGIIIATVTLAITSDFLDALAIAIVSGLLGIVGMVISAIISTRQYHRHLEPEVKDVKKKIDANRRESDSK